MSYYRPLYRYEDKKTVFDLNFYKGKKVFITGHTGFKGSWMCQVLLHAGAEVIGYALDAPTTPSLFEILGLSGHMKSLWGDVREYDGLFKAIKENKPEFVIHMAAQPLVRESYQKPAYTYETNVMGTVNILESIRNSSTTRSFINVTTDKVYLNREWEWGYRENEELNGYDPYSNSKSCAELATGSYRRSFFRERDVAVSTVRAGNVIGGGDFAADRIIPDCVRAVAEKKDIIIRNPDSVRPYQHVLEPVIAYLMIAKGQYEDKNIEGAYNVGPDEDSCITSGEMAEAFCAKWQKASGSRASWVSGNEKGPHEARFLKLDCSKIKDVFKWRPVWKIEGAIGKAVDWYYALLTEEDMKKKTDEQIGQYLKEMGRGLS